MAQRKTPSLVYAEYIDPEASGQVWLARLELIKTVKRVHPEFIKQLLAEVFPLYRQLKEDDQNMRKQKLDVAQHVPIHGRVGTNDEFLKIVGQTGAQSH